MAPKAVSAKNRRTMAAAALALSAGLSFTLASPSAMAAGTESNTAKPSVTASMGNAVYVVDQDLRALLTEFSKRIGANPDISKGVKGRVKKTLIPTDRQAFLDTMTKDYAIEWYFEGTTLHISSRDEMVSRLIGIRSLTVDRLNTQIRKVDLDPSRYPLQAVPEANAAMLTAPPSYVARVEVISESILKARKENGSDSIRFIKFGEKTKE